MKVLLRLRATSSTKKEPTHEARTFFDGMALAVPDGLATRHLEKKRKRKLKRKQGALMTHHNTLAVNLDSFGKQTLPVSTIIGSKYPKALVEQPC